MQLTLQQQAYDRGTDARPANHAERAPDSRAPSTNERGRDAPDGAPNRREYTITCVRRDPCHGHWTAHVTVDGHTVPVHRRYGSWQCQHGATRADVRPDIAAALQARVRPLERKEKTA